MNEKANTKKELRKFGLTIGIAFCILAALLLWRGKAHHIYFWGVGGLFLILGIFIPIALKPIEKVWMKIAEAMGWFMTRLILGIAFYLIFTPVALIMRLFNKDPLNRKIDKKAKSYWIKRKKETFVKERYERLF